MSNNFLKNAKISKKGQITIPSEIREILGVKSGDYITFGLKDENIVVLNRDSIKLESNKLKKVDKNV